MALGMRTDVGLQLFQRAWTQGDQYVTRVNKNRLDVERHTDYLNQVYATGFRLFAIFEQDGNTVMIFERRPVPAGQG